MIREIILDTETTGLDPLNGHRIVEIGAVEMINKSLTGKNFHEYINPERDMPEEAYRIHGISSEYLQDKPLFGHVATKFLEFIADSRLVIHNAPFDIKFLNYELLKIGHKSLPLELVTDTLVMARKQFPGSMVNLNALCQRYRVDNSNRKYHGALKDALLLSEVYVELTGGRQVAFELNTSTKKNITNYQSASKGNKIVLKPTAVELAEHQQLLAKINAQ